MSSNLTGGELGAMVSMAYKAMDVEFKKQYDPREEGKGITYETQSAYSNARQARAYQQWASSGDGSNFKWDNKNYFLVGEVEYGTFGKNHHDEFWRILTTAENLTFIEEAYAGQQRLKAQQRAHREQIQDTVVTAVSAVLLPVGGASLYVAYSAYKAQRAYEAGGEKGAVLSIGSSAANWYLKGAGVNVNMSYTYKDGYGGSVGVAGKLGDTGLPGNIGVSWSQSQGFGVNAGIGISLGENGDGGRLGLGFSVSERGGYGVNAGYTTPQQGGKYNGDIGLGVGYKWDKDGKALGMTGSLTVSGGKESDGGRWSGGLTYDPQNGYGAKFGITGQSGTNDFDAEIAWTQNGGYTSSFEMYRNAQRTEAQRQILLANAKKLASEGKYNQLTAEEKAALAEDQEQKAKAAEAQREEQENALQGLGWLAGKTEEEIEIAIAQEINPVKQRTVLAKRNSQNMTATQKQAAIALQEELENPNSQQTLRSKVEKKAKELLGKVSDQIDKIIVDLGNEADELKAAHDAFKQKPNVENASKLFEAFDKTKASTALAMTPYGGEVYDVLSISNDIYKERYGDAAVGMVAGLIPFLPAKWAKGAKNSIMNSQNPTVEKVLDFLSQKAKGASDAIAAKYASLMEKAPWRKAARGEEAIRLSEAYINDSGIAVLGSFKNVNVTYIDKAKNKNASYFDLGDKWDLLSPAQREAANKHFLDVIADKKQIVYLNIPKTKIRPDSDTAMEIEHLTKKKGYVWVNQWTLRPPK